MKKNKYEQVLQARLDLHGLFVREALIAVENFLQESRTKGFSVVQIITGKGLHSQQGPVLKKEVQSFLRDQHISFRDGKIQEGGSGTLIVLLS